MEALAKRGVTDVLRKEFVFNGPVSKECCEDDYKEAREMLEKQV